MGICASTKQGEKMMMVVPPSTSTCKVIHLDGSHQEFLKPIRAGEIVSQNPGCFLCCSDSMLVNSPAPRLPNNEELHPGQIYFLLPISKFLTAPLSLTDLCILAIVATATLPIHHITADDAKPRSIT